MQRKRKWPKKKISPFLKRMNQMFSCLVAGARGRCDVLRASLRKAIYIYFFLNNHDVVIFNVKVPFNAATFTQMSSAQGWFFLCGGERLVWLLCSWLIYVFSHQVSVFTWRVDWLPFCLVWFRTVNMSSEPQPAVWGLSHVASYSFSVRYRHWRFSAEQRYFHCLPCISCFFLGAYKTKQIKSREISPANIKKRQKPFLTQKTGRLFLLLVQTVSILP